MCIRDRGNTWGYSASNIYTSGDFVLEHDVILVTTNYRLGPFGWFAYSGLNQSSDNPLDNTANFGTLDIIKSLEWVNENISHFNGDPNNVTIFGESAGARNVISLMSSPLSENLFERGISQRGYLGSDSLEYAENNNIVGSRVCRTKDQIIRRRYIEMPTNHLGIFVPLETFKKYGLFDLRSKNRADFLNARAYDESIARLKLPSPVSLNWLKSTADPAEDFEHPLKGPYFSLREGNSEIAKLAIHFCKKAELLPAVLVLQIQSKDLKKLTRLGLLYQKISENFESNKVDENLTLVSTGRVPIPGGLNSKVSVFRDLNSLTEHYAIEIGNLDLSQPVLTRLHSACFTGDILHSLKCDCGEQLSLTINKIQLEKKGIILYLNQEGRGIGLANKMRAVSYTHLTLPTNREV